MKRESKTDSEPKPKPSWCKWCADGLGCEQHDTPVQPEGAQGEKPLRKVLNAEQQEAADWFRACETKYIYDTLIGYHNFRTSKGEQVDVKYEALVWCHKHVQLKIHPYMGGIDSILLDGEKALVSEIAAKFYEHMTGERSSIDVAKEAREAWDSIKWCGVGNDLTATADREIIRTIDEYMRGF